MLLIQTVTGRFANKIMELGALHANDKAMQRSCRAAKSDLGMTAGAHSAVCAKSSFAFARIFGRVLLTLAHLAAQTETNLPSCNTFLDHAGPQCTLPEPQGELRPRLHTFTD